MALTLPSAPAFLDKWVNSAEHSHAHSHVKHSARRTFTRLVAFSLPEGLSLPGGLSFNFSFNLPGGLSFNFRFDLPGGLSLPGGLIYPQTSFQLQLSFSLHLPLRVFSFKHLPLGPAFNFSSLSSPCPQANSSTLQLGLSPTLQLLSLAAALTLQL